MNWTTLVSAIDLASAIGMPELVVVDCRFVLAGASPDAGEQAWREAHIPGAGYVHLDRDLSDHAKPASEGRHPLPDAAAFCALLVRLGITPRSQVVAYDAGDGAMAASRFWWLLKVLGHERVAVLDGGYLQWTRMGLPVESQARAINPGHYHATYDLTRMATTADVERAGKARTPLLDARAPERYRGDVEPLDKKAGHIPGALNRPYSMNMADGTFRPAGELREAYAALLGSSPASAAILYCGSGVTACHNLLAMEHAGLTGARLFPPSWSGWIDDPAHPVAP